MFRLYDHLPSGNGYKNRLLMNQLGIPFERVEVDLPAGQTRTPEFLKINPIGRIPVLELAPGKYLPESNAILLYLSEGTPFQPDDRWQRAQIFQWMCFEQYSHEPNIATIRHWTRIGKATEFKTLVEMKRPLGNHALRVMDSHLREQPYFVGQRYTIADIALYAYTHVAGEGGFVLEEFPSICRWLERVREQPNHIEITDPGKTILFLA
jgi:glutathione S-transferase